jgi:transglutaminase-like putative cysteine protease
MSEGSKAAPSFVNYIAGISASYMLVTALSLLFESISAGTNQSNDLIQGAAVMGGGALITLIEIFFLRRNMRAIGGFGIGCLAEIGKFLSTVNAVKGIDTSILIGLYTATFASLLVSKFFRARIDTLSQMGVSRNLLNVLPTIIILLTFTGGSLLTNLGFGAISQAQNPEPFETDDVDFSLFKVPDWNAAYFLDNIMDQFTSGLQFPDQIMFNVTNLTPDGYESHCAPTGPRTAKDICPTQKPITYFRSRTFDQYKYDKDKAVSATWFESDYDSRMYSIEDIYSSEVPQIYEDELDIPPHSTNTSSVRLHTVARLEFSVPINHSATYSDQIPTVWNGQFGAFVSPEEGIGDDPLDGLRLNGQTCFDIGGSCNTYENSLPFSTFGDVSSVNLEVTNLEPSDNSILKYQMRYLQPNLAELTSFSLSRNDYANPAKYIPGLNDDWTAIQNYYLQIPNRTEGTMPSTNNLGATLTNYTDWSPSLWDLVQRLDNPGQTVFNQALALTQALAPQTGTEGLTFDKELWLGQQTGQAEHPAEQQEYIQWFLNRGKGVSLHFASTLTMGLRLMGIPARTVTGWAAGNTTFDTTGQQNVVTAYYTHAWTEALVPMRTWGGNFTYEWAIFDPMITALGVGGVDGGIATSTTTPTLLDAFAYDESIPVNATPGSDGLLNIEDSIRRVGVDQNHDSIYDSTNDSAIIGTSAVDPRIISIGVYTASVNSYQGYPTNIIGQANINITFQVVRWEETENRTVALPWNGIPGTDNYTRVLTDSTTYKAITNFTYYPLLHGRGNFWFIAIIGELDIDHPDCLQNGQVICINAFSDSDRETDNDVIEPPPYENNPFNINYSPHLFQIGGYTPLLNYNFKINNPPFKVNQENPDKNLIIPIKTNINQKLVKIPDEIIFQSQIRKNLVCINEEIVLSVTFFPLKKVV